MKYKEAEHIIPFSTIYRAVMTADETFKKNRKIKYFKFAIPEKDAQYHSIIISRDDEEA